MSKIINSTIDITVSLSLPKDNPLTITSTGTIIPATGDGIDGSAATTWYIINRGTVSSSTAAAIALAGSGRVDNAGSIAGAAFGFQAAGFSTLSNGGAISGGGFSPDDVNSIGVDLEAGGIISNSVYGSIVGFGSAVRIAGARGLVINQGSITSATDTAVQLLAGGVVTNGDTGLIQNFFVYGVDISGGSGSVSNEGSIDGHSAAVFLEAGGTVINGCAGRLSANNYGVIVSGGFGTVMNLGLIHGDESGGVELLSGGTVINGQHAVISSSATGVDISGAGGAVINDGSIWGIVSDGVHLASGGRVINGAHGTISSGDPTSAGTIGVEIVGGFGTVVNAGTILGIGGGYGVSLGAGGTVSNGGVIAGPDGGVVIEGGSGTVVNSRYGEISAEAFDSGAVVISGGIGRVVNDGTISDAGPFGTGVYLQAGGAVTNDQDGLIQVLGAGVFIYGGTGAVTNRGTISAAQAEATGVDLQAGGTVSNAQSGLISAASINGYGVLITGGPGAVSNLGTIIAGAVGVDVANGTVTNRGSISSGMAGVQMHAGGSVSNARVGSITGEIFGVHITGGAATVSNAGTISGAAHSVLFDVGTMNNRLIINPGAVFDGEATATLGSNSTIELAAGTGAISGIGASAFTGFDRLQVDAGANWTLSGNDTVGTVLDKGKLELAASSSLSVTTAVDPASTGLFQLDGGSTLEVAMALGIKSQMSFDTGSQLVIDHYAAFGQGAGTSSYAGPLLEHFGGNGVIDLKDFQFVGGISQSTSIHGGILQVQLSNGTEMATLDFQNSGIGSGIFSFSSDGPGGGVLITHS